MKGRASSLLRKQSPAPTAERKFSARSELGEALCYIIKRRPTLTDCHNPRLESDNNVSENTIRARHNPGQTQLALRGQSFRRRARRRDALGLVFTA